MKKSRIDEMICRREGIPALTREALERLQLKKLNDLLRREQERGGFYRNLPSCVENLKQLAELPFTTEEDLAEQGQQMLLCSQSEIQRVLSDATSGTTGRPKRVFYTLGDCENTVELFRAGLGEFVFPGSRTMICMPFSGPYGLGELIAKAIEELGATPLRVGVGCSYGELAAWVDREQPDTFVGMAVPLLSMLRMNGPGSLKRALVSGDACPIAVTEAIENILGSPLFPHYGSREMGLGGAITCPAHQGMHLRENHVIAEIVDKQGNVLPHGEEGELVITTIGMEAHPLIRYRTGDYTRILPEPCPCGSPTVRLDRLHRGGRAGKLQSLDQQLFGLEEIIDLRMSQKKEAPTLEILVHPDAELTLVKEWVRALLPEIVHTEWAVAGPEHRALYLGKRI